MVCLLWITLYIFILHNNYPRPCTGLSVTVGVTWSYTITGTVDYLVYLTSISRLVDSGTVGLIVPIACKWIRWDYFPKYDEVTSGNRLSRHLLGFLEFWRHGESLQYEIEVGEFEIFNFWLRSEFSFVQGSHVHLECFAFPPASGLDVRVVHSLQRQ